MNTEDDEFARIEREQAMRGVPDPIHYTDNNESADYISGWNDCRAAMLEQPDHQDMIGEAQDRLIAEQAAQAQPAQKRPQNCGTGYCSCIECVMEPAQQEPVGIVKDLFTNAAWDKLDVVGSTKVYLDFPPAQQEPCGWQFFHIGKWHNGMETNGHRAITKAAGVPIRDVYPSPQSQRNPLTDDKYEAIVDDLSDWRRYVEVDTAHQTLEEHVRQVLTDHGITKGNT